jgi:GxxExxY protein
MNTERADQRSARATQDEDMENIQKKDARLMKYGDITKKINGCFFMVYNKLGYGFLEKVYENAMRIELNKAGLSVVQQKPIQVWYENELVGEYFADLVVNDLVILELKATANFSKEHEAQLLNYLKATPYEVGLLLNFGPQPQHVRRVFDNNRKEWWLAKNQSL